MACCSNPDPHILEKNGRLFCRSCRRYLDQRSSPPEPPPSVFDETEDRDGVDPADPDNTAGSFDLVEERS